MSRPEAALVVIAKSPLPGRVKTRLCPPCTPQEAADIAAAALADTMEAAARSRPHRLVLVLDGPPGEWINPTAEVLPQRGRGLDERIANAFEDVGCPALLIGMDTPQVTAAALAECVTRLMADDVDAVLGKAEDGGFWAVGLRRPDRRAFVGVPMSEAFTGRAQENRLATLGLRVAPLPVLRDVDDAHDALAVAVAAPGGRFASAVRSVLDRGLAVHGGRW
jgi:uncharacterized protein